MRSLLIPTVVLLACLTPTAHGYIEVPYSLVRCVQESTNIVVMELTRINTEKNLLIFKKVGDLKGKHAAAEIKHNIGKKGFHEREWKNIMQWAEVGKKAVFLYNAESSETCLGTYWYQAYREGDWWGMSHAEPFLLRTFHGDPEKLADLITKILKNEEVVTTCFADGDKNQLHLRKGKLQRMKASLKKIDYDPKRDFVGWGGDGDGADTFVTTVILKQSSDGWRFLPEKEVKGKDWIKPNFDDGQWRQGKAPIGYGEDEIQKRKGTEVKEKGVHFAFRRVVDIPAELLLQKNAVFHLGIASDDHAVVYINGTLVDKDPEDDHEFAYWNREVDVPLKVLKPGRNVVAAFVKNGSGSSDIYLDMEFTAQVPVPRKKKDPTAVVANPKENPTVGPKDPLPQPEPRDPKAMQVNKQAKTVTINGAIAPRKLPNLDDIYPIEVIASWGAPRGQKAHETVVAFKGLSPSDVQKAMIELGLKPGKPAYGEGTKAQGPEVKIYLEFAGADGKIQKLPFEKLLVNRDGKPVPEFKWHFTGSVMKEPDPEKPISVFGADMTGTLMSIFPVTDSTVFQSHLTMKEEASLKLETNAKLLPKEGTAVKLIIQVR